LQSQKTYFDGSCFVAFLSARSKAPRFGTENLDRLAFVRLGLLRGLILLGLVSLGRE
jgi:hypothetical protein